MTTVYFYGSLSKYCDKFEVIDTTVRKAISIVAVQFKGMRKEIAKGSWKISRGKMFIGEEGLELTSGNEIHVYPALHGAASGTGQVILGTALIVAGVIVSPVNPVLGAYLVGTGIGMAVGGFITMLTKPQKTKYEDRGDGKPPSFLFNGPVNVSTQGLPVPVVIGKVRTGSVVVSAGLSTVDLSNAQYEELAND